MLRVKSRFLVLTVTAGIAALSMTGCNDGSKSREENRPNIIVVSIDTLRADRVSGYGYPEALTPNVDLLVDGGVVFERAVTPSGTTWPSHASMLTGLYPRYHGVRSNTHKLKDEVGSVAEILQSAGYQTGSFISFKGMHFLCGLDRGFDAASDRERRGPDDKAIREGRETTDMALEWLDSVDESGQPVFMWFHLFEPHGPYDLTQYSRKWMDDSGYDGVLADQGATMELLLEHTGELKKRSEDRKALNVLYDGEVALADRYLGEIIDSLDRSGRLDNSIVIFTSDHGQGLGEGGKMGHGSVLWEQVLHIPLVVRDFRSRSRIDRVEQTVGLIDVAPTILDFALGIALPDSQGRSLAAVLAGEHPEPQEYMAEIALRDENEVGDWYDSDALAVYTEGLKFVFRKDSFNVFETGEKPASVRHVEKDDSIRALAEYARSVAGEFLTGEMAPQNAELAESDIEALRSLGYLQ